MSVTWWLLLGYYWAPYEKNTTNTMIDIAVYDIKNRKLLMRAGGSSIVYDTCIPLHLIQQLKEHSYRGFDTATDNLLIELREKLEKY